MCAFVCVMSSIKVTMVHSHTAGDLKIIVSSQEHSCEKGVICIKKYIT